MSERPNIVIFNPDQWRGDVLGHVGHPAAVTPNLDRTAREDGVSFRLAFCQNPMCTPSRCSFMTGWYPHVRGHRTMSYMLHPDEPVLLKTLKDNGYFVWWGGKNDLVPGESGFGDYCDVKHGPTRTDREAAWLQPAKADWRGHPGDDSFFSFYTGRLEGDSLSGQATDHDWIMVRGAVDFIRNYDGDEPFCIFLALHYPHPPYAAEEPWFSMIDRGKVPPRAPVPENADLEPSLYQAIRDIQGLSRWTDERWAELQATYVASCARVDHQYGMVLDALREAGRYDDTSLFVFADHGDFTGDYGVVQKADNVFPDCLSRVPLVIKPPRSVPVEPRVSDALVELIDVPATIEELTGVGRRHTHFGRSLLPVISGKTDEHRDAVFCEGGRRYGEEAAKGLELIDEPVEENIYWSILKPFRTEAPAMGKATMLRTQRYKYVHRLYETDELYDLAADPQEVANRIEDPAMADVLAQLRARMMTFYLETADVVPHCVDARNDAPDSLARARQFNEAMAAKDATVDAACGNKSKEK